MNHYPRFRQRLRCALGVSVCAWLGHTAQADPFVGSRVINLRADDNISDGLQVFDMAVDVTTSTADGVSYQFDPTSPDALPLMMTRDGNWLELDGPQSFVPTTDVTEARVASDGTGGAFMFVGDNIEPGTDPNHYSVNYAVWSDRTAPVVIADMLGVWRVRQYVNLNILSDDVFHYQTPFITVTSPDTNKLTVSGIGEAPATYSVVGNQLLPDNPEFFSDIRVLVTGQGNIVFGGIGVEDFDPTDISLDIGLATRIPGDTDFDGDVDDADLGTMISNFTGPVGAAGGKTHADGDTDFDGDIDDADLGTMISSFTGPGVPVVVPEPGAALLLSGACLVLRRGITDRADH